MKQAVRKIDRALKRLYNLEGRYRAEDFLIQKPVADSQQGALFVQKESESNDLQVGIYLSREVYKELESFREWRPREWSRDQVSAFTVAAEEVSHFHYLLFHVEKGRSVSHLELELQGEIDKFILTFFANLQTGEAEKTFEALFEQLFHHFRLAENLSEEQRARYQAASDYARKFLL